MNRFLTLLFPFLLCQAAPSLADEPLDIAASYERIAADYELVDGFAGTLARPTLNRLTRDAYRMLILEAGSRADLSADDLFALAGCHEALAQWEQSASMYKQAMEEAADSWTPEKRAAAHLGLARVFADTELAEAETHLAAVIQLDPADPAAREMHAVLADVYVRRQDWEQAIKHLEQYEAFARPALEELNDVDFFRERYASARQRLERVRQVAGLVGEKALPLEPQMWVQGEPVNFDELAGKVVVIDFFALFLPPSRERMQVLERLRSKYSAADVQFLGVAVARQRLWNALTFLPMLKEDVTLQEEAESIQLVARRLSISYPLALVDHDAAAGYAVRSAPHTVVLDKSGVVRHVILNSRQHEPELAAAIAEMIGG